MNPKYVKRFYKLINWYPPFLGAGIRLKETNAEKTRFVVQLKLSWFNRNAAGTHFGGSLFSMCDPFFIFIIFNYFGNKNYVIWDKSASIKYIKPAKGTVTVIFEIPQEKLQAMKKEVDENNSKSYLFSTQITDEIGAVVAEVVKEIYIRKHRNT